MRNPGSSHPEQGPSTPVSTPALRMGFTLLELILVMLILAIAAAAVVPTVSAFALGRATDNAGILLINLSTYARTQAMSEGKTYRLNFDTQQGQIWLTSGFAGVFTEPLNDFGRHFPLAPGIKMQVDVTPQPNATYVVSPTVQTTTVRSAPAFGQAVIDTNSNLVQVPHADAGTYVEFLPSGRTDPVHIQLTDKVGKVMHVGLATSTDVMHVLSAREIQ